MNNDGRQTETSPEVAFESLRNSSKATALLTTFRRDGRGVDTPVEIVLQDGKAYFATRDRRPRQNPATPARSGDRQNGFPR